MRQISTPNIIYLLLKKNHLKNKTTTTWLDVLILCKTNVSRSLMLFHMSSNAYHIILKTLFPKQIIELLHLKAIKRLTT